MKTLRRLYAHMWLWWYGWCPVCGLESVRNRIGRLHFGESFEPNDFCHGHSNWLAEFDAKKERMYASLRRETCSPALQNYLRRDAARDEICSLAFPIKCTKPATEHVFISIHGDEFKAAFCDEHYIGKKVSE